MHGGGTGLYLTEGCFVANLVAWCYYRMYIFPVKVIYGATLKWAIWLAPWNRCARGLPEARCAAVAFLGIGAPL